MSYRLMIVEVKPCHLDEKTQFRFFFFLDWAPCGPAARSPGRGITLQRESGSAARASPRVAPKRRASPRVAIFGGSLWLCEGSAPGTRRGVQTSVYWREGPLLRSATEAEGVTLTRTWKRFE